MILGDEDTLVLNDQSITSPHNEPQRSPGFVQKQPPEAFRITNSGGEFGNYIAVFD